MEIFDTIKNIFNNKNQDSENMDLETLFDLISSFDACNAFGIEFNKDVTSRVSVENYIKDNNITPKTFYEMCNDIDKNDRKKYINERKIYEELVMRFEDINRKTNSSLKSNYCYFRLHNYICRDNNACFSGEREYNVEHCFYGQVNIIGFKLAMDVYKSVGLYTEEEIEVITDEFVKSNLRRYECFEQNINSENTLFDFVNPSTLFEQAKVRKKQEEQNKFVKSKIDEYNNQCKDILDKFKKYSADKEQ